MLATNVAANEHPTAYSREYHIISRKYTSLEPAPASTGMAKVRNTEP